MWEYKIIHYDFKEADEKYSERFDTLEEYLEWEMNILGADGWDAWTQIYSEADEELLVFYKRWKAE